MVLPDLGKSKFSTNDAVEKPRQPSLVVSNNYQGETHAPRRETCKEVEMKLNRKVVATLVVAALTVLGTAGMKTLLFIRELALALTPAS